MRPQDLLKLDKSLRQFTPDISADELMRAIEVASRFEIVPGLCVDQTDLVTSSGNGLISTLGSAINCCSATALP